MLCAAYPDRLFLPVPEAARLQSCLSRFLKQAASFPSAAACHCSECRCVPAQMRCRLRPHKRMVVAVLHFGALCGHSGVPHYRLYFCRKPKAHPPGGKWSFIDTELRPGSICDSGRICPTDLTGNGKDRNDPVLLLLRKAFRRNHKNPNRQHITAPPRFLPAR